MAIGGSLRSSRRNSTLPPQTRPAVTLCSARMIGMDMSYKPKERGSVLDHGYQPSTNTEPDDTIHARHIGLQVHYRRHLGSVLPGALASKCFHKSARIDRRPNWRSTE